MSKYSTQSDIKDELIKQYTKESDHQEAEEYVEKVLSKIGTDTANAGTTPLLTNLSATYATYKRAFYESEAFMGDIFHQKYLSYEKELMNLTAEVIKKHIDAHDDTKIFHKVFNGDR